MGNEMQGAKGESNQQGRQRKEKSRDDEGAGEKEDRA